jgi:hypothetical protein
VLLAQPLLVPVQVLPVQVLPVQVPEQVLPVQVLPVLLAPGPNPPMGWRSKPTGPNCQSKTLTSQN